MKKQKILTRMALVMVVIFTLSSFTACSQKRNEGDSTASNAVSTEGASTGSQKEQSKEPIPIKMFVLDKSIQENSYIKSYIEKETNTSLQITQVSTADMDNKLNMLLAGGDRPEIIQCQTDTMEVTLLKNGILLPFEENWEGLINLKSARDNAVWDLMRYADGKIYSIGIKDRNPLHIIAYRKDWLDKFKMKVPTTIDEYYEIAKKMAKGDPDGNGKNDTYAFGNYKNEGVSRWFDHIFGAYGALPSYWMERDGKVVNGSILPEMKDALKFLNKMYSEGLIDPEFVTDDSKRWQQKVKNGVFGAGMTKVHVFDHNNWNNYYGSLKKAYPKAEHVFGPVLQEASKNPIGISRGSERGWIRTMICKEAPHAKEALKLLDWFTDSKNNKFLQYGKEGEHYKIENNKVVRTIDDATIEKLDLNKFLIGNTVLYDNASDELLSSFEHTDKNSIKSPVDGIFIDEESKYGLKLKQLTDIRYIEMITGQVSIDKGFDAFVNEWNSKGGSQLTEAYNKALTKK